MEIKTLYSTVSTYMQHGLLQSLIAFGDILHAACKRQLWDNQLNRAPLENFLFFLLF